MRRQLDMSKVGRMILWLVIVMSKHSLGVEKVHKWLRWSRGVVSLVLDVVIENWLGKILWRIEIICNALDLCREDG